MTLPPEWMEATHEFEAACREARERLVERIEAAAVPVADDLVGPARETMVRVLGRIREHKLWAARRSFHYFIEAVGEPESIDVPLRGHATTLKAPRGFMWTIKAHTGSQMGPVVYERTTGDALAHLRLMAKAIREHGVPLEHLAL